MAATPDFSDVPMDKKKYIMEQLNPVLEEMVAECIHNTPVDPIGFMMEWLEHKKAIDEDKKLSTEEKERISKENANLQQDVEKVTSQVQEAAKLAHQNVADSEEEEEEDDVDDEPPPDFEKGATPKARTSVSAEAYGEWNQKKAFVAPVVPKTDDQKDRLKACLCQCFMFSSLDDNDLAIIVGAVSEMQVEPQQRVINQGEDGDFLFVIESGKLECLISQGATEKCVKTCVAGDVFGELALLYNCPRAASVHSTEKCVLWKVDRDTFNHIVREGAQKKRARYDAFLSKVSLLASMDAYERSQLADTLKPETFDGGQIVVNQGEIGQKFYIIEEGEAAATKNGIEVMRYSSGDYFGELALIRNQPRAATVTCVARSKLLSIDSASFKRLLNVADLLEKATRYT